MFVFSNETEMCESVCEGVYAEECVLGGGGGGASFRPYQCVCAHALFPSMHGLSLCISVLVHLCGVCALFVDFGARACPLPTLLMCQCCVCVLWLRCISLSGLDRFEQSGTGLPKVFIAPL